MPIVTFRAQYFFLSNFYPCCIVFEGKEYGSAEHAFQAMKAADAADAERIRTAPMPSLAKRLGRTVKLRAGWDETRLDVMERILRQKFADPALAERLLATGRMELVEGNAWGDRFWGVVDGHGENHLGRLLMRIRSELAAARE